MNLKYKILILSVLFGFFAWLLDGIIDYLFLLRGTFLGTMIFTLPQNRIYMRFAVVVLFFIFGLFISGIITKLKETEEALKKQSEELKRSNEELEQFASIASHDLQEPLRMVSSYVQLLAHRNKDKLDKEAMDFINYAVDGVNRMQQLINDLLTYSRIIKQGSSFKLTNCAIILKNVLRDLQMLIKENKAVVENDPLPTIMCDEIQLGQVFQNLINNAIKFRSVQPPRIYISVEEKDEEWIFSVCDNGIGFDPKYAECIFIIFQRLHDRKTYSGTGIGLAICKKIIERHGGCIWVSSKPGEGSTFFFNIPKEVKDRYGM